MEGKISHFWRAILPLQHNFKWKLGAEGRNYVYSLIDTNRSQNTGFAPTLFSVFVDRFNQAAMNTDEQFPPNQAINQHL